MGVYTNKSQHAKRINRIQGQLGGIMRMLEQERDCTEIVTQIQAARAALAVLGQEIVGEQAQGCTNLPAAQQKKTLQTLINNLFKLS